MNSTHLPDVLLTADGPVTREFLSFGCTGFRSAADHLHRLPYGRNSSRSDCTLVLREGRGTCSSKHALLALLARELGIRLHLGVGIYIMTETNTPGVGTILQRHGIDGVPEAHCYLVYNGRRIDLTRYLPEPQPRLHFLYEEYIEPHQTAHYKVELHRRFVRRWCEQQKLDVDTVWAVREECIAALEEQRQVNPPRA